MYATTTRPRRILHGSPRIWRRLYTPRAYELRVSCQNLGDYPKAIPRWTWCLFLVVIEFVRAIAGHNHLFKIFEQFCHFCSWWTTIFEMLMLFYKLRGTLWIGRLRRIKEASHRYRSVAFFLSLLGGQVRSLVWIRCGIKALSEIGLWATLERG